MSNPKAKFFCEYCDTEVPQKAIVCPKCPHFGHTGTQREFANGCKACGYAFSNGTSGNSTNQNKSQTKLPPKARYKTRKAAIQEIQKRESKTIKEDSLPAWVYILSISILGILLYILISKN